MESIVEVDVTPEDWETYILRKRDSGHRIWDFEHLFKKVSSRTHFLWPWFLGWLWCGHSFCVLSAGGLGGSNHVWWLDVGNACPSHFSRNGLLFSGSGPWPSKKIRRKATNDTVEDEQLIISGHPPHHPLIFVPTLFNIFNSIGAYFPKPLNHKLFRSSFGFALWLVGLDLSSFAPLDVRGSISSAWAGGVHAGPGAWPRARRWRSLGRVGGGPRAQRFHSTGGESGVAHQEWDEKSVELDLEL